MQTKVIIADASLASRKGLIAFIQRNENIECIAEAYNTKILTEILEKQTADLLIINYCCKHCFPLDIINKIKTLYPDLKVLIISHEKSYKEIKKIIDIGIKSCLFHDCSEKEIMQAIEACIKGTTSFPAQIITASLENASSKKNIEPIPLSQRENEIIRLIATGLTGKEIAKELFLSIHTINTHRKNIVKKLNIKSTAELVLYAIRLGLISLDR